MPEYDVTVRVNPGYETRVRRTKAINEDAANRIVISRERATLRQEYPDAQTREVEVLSTVEVLDDGVSRD